MKARDHLGWPVVTFKGRWFVNFIRYLVLTNIKQTWLRRNQSNENTVTSNSDVTQKNEATQ